MNLLQNLNEQQLAAVTLPNQSALILAGAGSGKTRVLTTRIAWLIQTGQMSPQSVLAVTFTNKAAKEMMTRLSAMLPINTRGMWIGTFHGLCNRFLRAHWKQAGLAAAVIGFEEISDAALARLNKRSSLAVNIAAMGILKDLGIRVIGDFIVDPEYTEADFDALERFVAAHAIDLPLPSILTPLPGTPLHREMRHKITIQDLDYYTFTNAVCLTRMEPKLFYQAYAAMLKRFLKHISHG